MEDINQTKEGFIKSMILFVCLLVICFTPFIAFSGKGKQADFKEQAKTINPAASVTAIAGSN